MQSISDGRSRDDPGELFASHRPRMRRIAFRLLGSLWSADDAVQETWLRFQRAEVDSIENVEAWLNTVVSRVCVDQLRWRAARPEDPDAEIIADEDPSAAGPEALALRADEVGEAMHLVLEVLNPRERLAFVLHDVFGLSFDDIAPILDRTPVNARQLASRARRRIRGAEGAAERARHREATDAFLAAAREGDFGGLLQLLDPEVELRSDDEVVALAAADAEHGAPLLRNRVRGADAVARVFAGRAALARTGLLDGLAVVVYAPEGAPKAFYLLHTARGRIDRIDAIGQARQLEDLAITLG
ncbi:sigma-70 family RNA polymerase sigma factor [Glycomyces xiaoerkulensis]|uniref:sigma-70 family RNA polymerase sigma factor n=1 Tax=Glycomyces xiaoerkulensis TaxID=2038139 RepID=UPI000C26BD2A|nr:sigma-70 family RNA polymerase sigma factor [Glycomyces xiaoerkulensis]